MPQANSVRAERPYLASIENFRNHKNQPAVVIPKQSDLFDIPLSVPAEGHADIPESIPYEFHGIWESMSAGTKKFAMDSFANDPEELRSFLEIHQPIEQMAVESAKKTHQEIAKVKSQKQLKLFSPFPTELTRTSPFFPMGTKEICKRTLLSDVEIASHSWGKILYTGPKLSVTDEDLLLYLLATINEANEKYIGFDENGRKTYSYKGSIYKILKMKVGDKRQPTTSDYTDAISSIKLMTGAVISLVTYRNTPEGKKVPKATNFSSLLTGGTYDYETGQISISVNPFFFETYQLNSVTWMDVAIRSGMKSPISKALYRFVMSHQADRWQGEMMKLAASMNLDPNLPANKVRDRIRGAIKEMVAIGVLKQGSCVESNTVILIRVPVVLPKKKVSGKTTVITDI